MQPAKRKLIIEQRRKALKVAWSLFIHEHQAPRPSQSISADIIHSWQRSVLSVKPQQLAPISHVTLPARWESPLLPATVVIIWMVSLYTITLTCLLPWAWTFQSMPVSRQNKSSSRSISGSILCPMLVVQLLFCCGEKIHQRTVQRTIAH